MSDLVDEASGVTSTRAKKVSESDLENFLLQKPGWQLVREDGVLKLRKIYEFENFEQALSFANRIGVLAEEYQHHPDLVIRWGACTVIWWSHELGGLQRNDLLLSAKTDLLFRI